MREEVASMPDGEDVEWSDAHEREFRRRYVEMRYRPFAWLVSKVLS